MRETRPSYLYASRFQPSPSTEISSATRPPGQLTTLENYSSSPENRSGCSTTTPTSCFTDCPNSNQNDISPIIVSNIAEIHNSDQKFIGDWAYIAVIDRPLRGVLPWSKLLSDWVILSLCIHSVQFFWGILTSILSLLMLFMTPRYPFRGPLPIVIDFPTLSSSSSGANPAFTPVFIPFLPTFSRFLATTAQLSAFSTITPLVLSNSGLNKKR